MARTRWGEREEGRGWSGPVVGGDGGATGDGAVAVVGAGFAEVTAATALEVRRRGHGRADQHAVGDPGLHKRERAETAKPVDDVICKSQVAGPGVKYEERRQKRGGDISVCYVTAVSRILLFIWTE